MTSNGPGPREPTPGRNPTLGPEPAIGMGMPALDFQSRSQTEGRHPAVQDAAVVGVPDATWGEAGVAFVVLGGSKEVTAADLNALLASRLAKYKIPKDFIFVESLPRTSYGKVTKAELREAYLCSGSNAPGH